MNRGVNGVTGDAPRTAWKMDPRMEVGSQRVSQNEYGTLNGTSTWEPNARARIPAFSQSLRGSSLRSSSIDAREKLGNRRWNTESLASSE